MQGTFETIAEIAVALTGFAGVIAILGHRGRRDWSPSEVVLLKEFRSGHCRASCCLASESISVSTASAKLDLALAVKPSRTSPQIPRIPGLA